MRKHRAGYATRWQRRRVARARRIWLALAIVALVFGLSATALVVSGFQSRTRAARVAFDQGASLLAQNKTLEGIARLEQAIGAVPEDVALRLKVAQLLFAEGQLDRAFGQNVLVLEEAPGTEAALVALFRIATLRYDDQAARLRVAQIAAQLPGTAAAQEAQVWQSFADAAAAGEPDLIAAARRGAERLVAVQPDALAAHLVMIEASRALGEIDAALAGADVAIGLYPKLRLLQEIKLSILNRAGRSGEATAHLEQMFRALPTEPDFRNWLLENYQATGQVEKALGLLRQVSDMAGNGWDTEMAVVDFAQRNKGSEAAELELRRIQAAHRARNGAEAALPYGAELARWLKARGQADSARQELALALQGVPMSPEVGDLHVMLAQWAEEAEDEAEAGRIVDAVLALDPMHSGAIQMKAKRLIATGETAEALRALQAGLAQSPYDSRLMLLMADAYRARGEIKLEAERLQAALDASDSGVEESLRLSAFLEQQGSVEAAGTVLAQALLKHPAELALLQAAARSAIARFDWARADELVADLKASGAPEAGEVVDEIDRTYRATVLQHDRLERLLDEAIAAADPALVPALTLAQGQMRSGRLQDAATALAGLRAEHPEQVRLVVIEAWLWRMAGNQRRAREMIAARLANFPDDHVFAAELFGLLQDAGETVEAEAVLAHAVARPKPSIRVLLLQAQTRLAAGDGPGAQAAFDRALDALDAAPVAAPDLLTALVDLAGEAPALMQSPGRVLDRAAGLAGSSDAGARAAYGWLLCQTGQPQAARPLLEQAVRDQRSDPDTVFRLGQCLALLGDGQAQSVLYRARTLAQDQAPELVARIEAILGAAGRAGPR